jgi:monovalent cation/hydrogen antiporter
VRALYNFRTRRFKAQAGKTMQDGDENIEDRSLAYQRLMHEIYATQRGELVRLRNERRISSDVMRRVERELDLEEQRLEV